MTRERGCLTLRECSHLRGAAGPVSAILPGMSSRGTGPAHARPLGPTTAPWRVQPLPEPAQPPLPAASAAASALPAPGTPATVDLYPPSPKGEQNIKTGQVV